MKQGEIYFLSFLRERVFSLCLMLFIFFFNKQDSNGQWKKIHTFDFSLKVTYFLDIPSFPSVGFVGSGFGTLPGELWRTGDSGRTWIKVSDNSWQGPIHDIVFKDSLTGWAAIGDPNGVLNLNGGCYKTTDGGITWQLIPVTAKQLCTALYYNKSNHYLFLSVWGNSALISSDEGVTWKPIFGTQNLNGFAFFDDKRGYASTVSGPYIYTVDGGFNWNRQWPGSDVEVWQPLAIPNTNTIFTYGDFSRVVYRSDDFGATWFTITPQLTYLQTGTIRGDFGSLYIQNDQGIFKSIDSGRTWLSLCGPATSQGDVRFYLKGKYLYAGNGLLYLNTSGKGSGPRLQIEKNNTTRHITGTTNAFPISFFYSHEAYNESVDSLTFVINYSGAVQYFRDSVCAGWTVIRREITDSTIRFVLKRIDPSAPALDSLLLKIYFQGVVAKETTGMLTLDEINFNQDVTFRDCMIASLSKTDSLFIDISDQCGDSTLRQFITTGKILEITSIHPNPSQDEISVALNSAVTQDAVIEILNALGKKVFMQNRSIAAGISSVQFDTKNLAQGVYIVRIQNRAATISQSFVKIQ